MLGYLLTGHKRDACGSVGYILFHIMVCSIKFFRVT